MSVRLDRDRVIRLGAVAAAFALGLVVLWQLLARLLYTDRGLDLTDEGLYLLAADPPSSTAAWVVPFGWHTRWLFSLVDHDIADFRTAAAVLAVALGAWTGYITVRRAEGVVAGGVTSLMLFAGLLRTPGYNWVNLVGLLFAAAATLGTRWSPLPERPLRSVRFQAGCAGIAGGAVFAVVAKPTSGPSIVVVSLLFVLVVAGRRAALWAAALVAPWIAAFIATAVVVGLWPVSFVHVFGDAARFPVPSDDQTLGSASWEVVRLPLTCWEALRSQPHATQLLVLAAVAVAVVAPRARARWIAMAPLALCTVAALGVALPVAHLGLADDKGRFAWVGTSTWVWLLVLGCLLHVVAHRGTNAGAARSWAPSALLVGMSLMFAFGSGHGPFRQTGLGAVLPALAGLALVARTGGHRVRRVSTVVLTAALVVGATATMVASVDQPYRIADMDELVQPMSVGPRAAPLLVDVPTESLLTGLRTAAADGGWCDGTRLLGFVWRWSSTLPYHLGARVPDTLMVTLFGYPNSVAIAEHTLSRLDATWSDAWVLVSDVTTLQPEQADTTASALALLDDHVGRHFPDDYELAASVGDVQLWRPIGAGATRCGGASDGQG